MAPTTGIHHACRTLSSSPRRRLSCRPRLPPPPGRRGRHPQAPGLLAEALAISPPTRQTIPESERRAAQALLLRLQDLQPGTKRVWVRATRRAGADGRLLLAESYLAATYHLWTNEEPCGEVGPGGAPNAWGFYRTVCYFVARWHDRRFRMGSSSVARLKVILNWWGTDLQSDDRGLPNRH